MLALSAAVGCNFFGTKDQVVQRYDARRTTALATDEMVYLNVALIERPLGDPFLDREVWEAGDEQGIEPLELKSALEKNGLRVCQFGLLPDRLQALLSSPRFCPNPRRLRVEPQKPATVHVGASRPASTFTVHLGSEPQSLSLRQARFEFAVVPLPEEEGRVRLRFTPRVRHGRPRMQHQVARDPDGQLRWAVEPTEPTEEFADLCFEVVVGSGEFVAIGPWPGCEGTLGHACFVPEGQKVQHLLVLRAGQVAPGGEESAGYSAPLAVQASRTTARGSSR
jgi:hypothetical protein